MAGGGGNAIASGSVVLTANADGLKSGLDKAGKDVQGWGARIGNTLSTAFNAKGGTMGGLQSLGAAVVSPLVGLASKAKGLLTGAGVAIGTMVGGPIGGAIGGAIGSGLGGIGEVVVGAIAHPFEKLDLFRDIVKQSAALGISASQFQGLSVVMAKAGIEGEGVSQVFASMGKQIADVASGHGKGAARAFEMLGLDAQKLIAMKPDQQFLAIADAFAAMPPGAAQASAAVHLFKGNAAGLLPELQKGSAGIQGLIDKMKGTGAVLSDDQLKAAAGASRAWKDAKVEIKSAWDGLANRATLIAAPVIKFVSQAVSKFFAFMQPVFEWVGRAVAKVADLATIVFEQLGKWVDVVVREVSALAGEFGGLGADIPTVQDVIVLMFRTVGTAAAYTWDVVKLGAGAFAYFASFAVEAIGDAMRFFKDMILELTGWGHAVAEGLGMHDTAKMFTDAGDVVEKAEGRLKKSAKEMRNWGLGVGGGDLDKSAKEFNAWLDKALEPKKAGEKVGDGVVKGAIEEIEDGLGGAKFAAALKVGSTEAYSLVLKNATGANQQDHEKEALKEAKRANKLNEKKLKEAEKTNKILGAVGVV